MKKILTIDKIPYLLSFLFGLATYQLNHIITYVVDAPYICYEYKILQSSDTNGIVSQNIELQIENLNRKLSFSNLVFDVKYRTELPKPREVFNPGLVAISPATILPDALVESRNHLINRYSIPRLQPGGKYLLKFSVKHLKSMKEFPKLYLSCSESVFLTEVNTEVYLVRNQLLINVVLFSVWMTFILIYFIYFLNILKNEKST